MKNNIVIHGPFQDDYDYENMIRIDSLSGTSYIKNDIREVKTKTKVKTLLKNRKIGKK